MKKTLTLLCCLTMAASMLPTTEALAQKTKKSKSHKSMYHKDWVDFNKNGVKDIYEDPTRSIDERVEDLLQQMTLEENTPWW